MAKSAHKVVNGTCTKCKRTGTELALPCPGYTTAAESTGMTWPTHNRRVTPPQVKKRRRS